MVYTTVDLFIDARRGTAGSSLECGLFDGSRPDLPFDSDHQRPKCKEGCIGFTYYAVAST
eukprot:COSAG02_NODE_3598_length_6507_cov_15.869538_3_plen_60_part_00